MGAFLRGKGFMKITKLKLSSIKPYEGNAKLHPEEQIKQIMRSIEEFGNNDPIAVDEDYVIIEGHGRYEALKRLGYQEAECVILTGLSEDQKNAYRLVHNKLTMNSGFDLESLYAELEKIEIDMTEFDFSYPEPEPEDYSDKDLDETPEVDEENPPKTKLGDMYKLGNHYLLCGDSTDPKNLERLMQGEKADLLLTDPPYNVSYVGKTKDALTIENDDMEDTEFRDFLKKAFNCANEQMKEGATFYIWHADSEGYNFRGACHDIGWKVRQCLIWVKNSMVMGRQDYQWKHEPCLYGWKDGAAHNWYSDRTQTTTLEFDRPTKSELHPTMKPVALFSYLAENSSKKSDIVLDPFGGSGTTIVVCETTGRRCRMMELDPKYCDVIISRWETLTGKTAELVSRKGE